MDVFCFRLGQFLEPHQSKRVGPGGEKSSQAALNYVEADPEGKPSTPSPESLSEASSTTDLKPAAVGSQHDLLRVGPVEPLKESLKYSCVALGNVFLIVLACLAISIPIGALVGYATSYNIGGKTWTLAYTIWGHGVFGVLGTTLTLIQPLVMAVFLFPGELNTTILVVGGGVFTVLVNLTLFGTEIVGIDDPGHITINLCFIWFTAAAVLAAYVGGKRYGHIKRFLLAVPLSSVVVSILVAVYQLSLIPYFISHPGEGDRAVLRIVLHPLFWSVGLFLTRLATRYLPHPEDPTKEVGITRPYFGLLLLPQFFSSFYGRLLTSAIDDLGTVTLVTVLGAALELILRVSVLKRDELFTRVILGKKKTTSIFVLSRPSAYMYGQFLFIEMVFEQGCIIVAACYIFFYKAFYPNAGARTSGNVVWAFIIQWVVEIVANLLSCLYEIRYMRLSMHEVLRQRPKYYLGYVCYVFLVGTVFIAVDAYDILKATQSVNPTP